MEARGCGLHVQVRFAVLCVAPVFGHPRNPAWARTHTESSTWRLCEQQRGSPLESAFDTRTCPLRGQLASKAKSAFVYLKHTQKGLGKGQADLVKERGSLWRHLVAHFIGPKPKTNVFILIKWGGLLNKAGRKKSCGSPPKSAGWGCFKQRQLEGWEGRKKVHTQKAKPSGLIQNLNWRTLTPMDASEFLRIW